MRVGSKVPMGYVYYTDGVGDKIGLLCVEGKVCLSVPSKEKKGRLQPKAPWR